MKSSIEGRVFVAALAWAMVLTAAFAVAEVAGSRPLGGDAARPGSLLGNASDQGIFGVIGLALFIPGFLRWASSRQMRRTAPLTPLLGLASAIVVIATSASRAALVAAGSVVVLHGILAWRSSGARGVTAARLGAVAAAVGGLGLLLPLTRSRVVGASDLSQATVTNRLDLWGATLQLVRNKPVAGAGPNGFADAITTHLGDTWFSKVGSGSWVESPHDVFLQVLAAGGLLGLGVVVMGVVLAVRQVRTVGFSGPLGSAGLVALVGWVVGVSTHATSPGTTLLAAFVAGSLLARGVDASAPTVASTRRRRAATAAVAAWVVVLGCGLVGDVWTNRGMARLGSDPAAAERDFARADALRPWDADLPLMIAEAYAGAMSSGVAIDTDAATRWSHRSVESLPGSTRALKARGIVAFDGGDQGLALDSFERAAVLSPTDPEVWHWLGGARLLGGDIEGAVTALERAHALDPEDASIAETLAYARTGAS